MRKLKLKGVNFDESQVSRKIMLLINIFHETSETRISFSTLTLFDCIQRTSRVNTGCFFIGLHLQNVIKFGVFIRFLNPFQGLLSKRCATRKNKFDRT